jgi:hypothetical protein
LRTASARRLYALYRARERTGDMVNYELANRALQHMGLDAEFPLSVVLDGIWVKVYPRVYVTDVRSEQE